MPEGKLFTLLGPSGLRQDHDACARSPASSGRRAGEIAVGGRVVYSSGKGVFVAPNRRGFGMVFQSYAIWPHMNVFENVAFPLEVGAAATRASEIRENVMRVLHGRRSSITSPIARPPSSPAASSSAWRWRGRW